MRRTLGRVDWKSTNSSGSISAKRAASRPRAHERQGGGRRLAGVVPALEGAHQRREPGGRRDGVPSAAAASVHGSGVRPAPATMIEWCRSKPTAPTVAGLRAGDDVDAVFACSRKDRLTARTGLAVPGAGAARPHGRDPGPRVPDADLLAGRFERGDLVRVRGRVERFRDELQVDVKAIERAEAADPASFLPVAYRDLDELDGFLEHLAREVHDPEYRALLERAARRRGAARRLAPRAVHPRRPPRLPGRAARAHRRRRDARAGGLPAAPAAELRTC